MKYKVKTRTKLQFHSKKLASEKVGYDDMFMFDRYHLITEDNSVSIDDFGTVWIVPKKSNDWTVLEEATYDFQYGDFDTVYLIREFEIELEDGTLIFRTCKVGEYRLYEDKGGLRQWIRQDLIDFEPFD